MIFCISFFLLFGAIYSSGAIVDTVDTWSTAMRKNIKAVVIRPDDYAQRSSMPVVYLLHGYSGAYDGWIKLAKGLEKLADRYSLMIVCPDGGFSSWYWDSPVDSSYRYETYFASELIPWVDARYKTIRSKQGRGITGLSMGGHGAMYLALRHQDLFGAAGTMSGGVDIRPFPLNWDMAKRLGPYAANPDRWDQYTVANMLHLLTPKSLSIIIDCGTEDFFFRVNEKLHEDLLLRNIAHEYIVRPGAHNAAYWANAVQFQMLYMHLFFQAPAGAEKQ